MNTSQKLASALCTILQDLLMWHTCQSDFLVPQILLKASTVTLSNEILSGWAALKTTTAHWGARSLWDKLSNKRFTDSDRNEYINTGVEGSVFPPSHVASFEPLAPIVTSLWPPWGQSEISEFRDWPRQMSPSWMIVCLQTLQCLAFLKVFTRNVWEWRASNSSGCRKT